MHKNNPAKILKRPWAKVRGLLIISFSIRIAGKDDNNICNRAANSYIYLIDR
jgi:hypothetical protein